VLAGVIYTTVDISWPLRLLLAAALLAFFGVSEWVLWAAIQPPVLRADGIEVTCAARFDRQRMQRCDLAFIYRGQVKPRGQPRGSWARSYIFAAADGRVGISCSPLIFTPDGMAQFAQRLQIPIRGDFSVQVTDRVDPTRT
jgi:hypothetical protein